MTTTTTETTTPAAAAARPGRAKPKAPAIKAEPKAADLVGPKKAEAKTLACTLLGMSASAVLTAGALRFASTEDAKNGLLMYLRADSIIRAFNRNKVPVPNDLTSVLTQLSEVCQNSHNPLTVQRKNGDRLTIIPSQFVKSAVTRSDLASGRVTFV